MTQKVTMVLGGAASGKSAFAEGIVTDQGLARIYLATSQAFDDEMREKIADHVAARGSGWTTIEEPLDLPGALRRISPGHAVLVDCLTLWLTNLILADRDPVIATDDLIAALEACPAPVTFVTNEVGQGIVPEHALSRRFRNAQGRLNIRIAARADTVVQVVAGLPNLMKGSLT
ncbi:bifunctional adenosylcobinamide kinase/adenosylcobinamide-phosphate guanylyltransferase [Pseudooceanicola nitratireducens]|uniref:bifunctional adenosylcobinamide kinase/adenosylcobinamide-phosphate guanylyltransferase n=1 Tax=Pseudooceanicola nitratireducens TaxID=517719 RepID=UPI001C986D7A|nr:bifunctional adenosylcobinamide kinase/adenosylcobinamide-phosphate guanylyltransferase [Pseudooceanicola nitratireducens]MBY6165135.1 bifunctional adenosylcobinamide kinase/adenosylcobinamide-phosphate guanylyltransferase [Pseudooceanicola nitratireducens]